jgi:hypothetical protein
MKTSPHFTLSLTTGFAVLLGLVVFTPAAHAAKKNPTSKLYVADVEGTSEINTGEVVEDLIDKSVHSAEGTIIETKVKSTNAMVLSNGTGMFVDPETRLEVKRFMQEPFNPNRTDPEVEPSISQTQANLPHGTIGLCTSKMIAGSTMVYTTPFASIAILGRKAVIQSQANQTIVSALEGPLTVRGDQFNGGETIKQGQQAIITRASAGAPPTITIQPIPDDQRGALDDKVNAACMARKQAHFTNDKVNDQEILVQQIVPENLDPIITISAAAK